MQPETSGESEEPGTSSQPRRRRNLTIYDVVAGRVGLNGLLTAAQQASLSAKPLAPEELLFKDASTANIDLSRHYNADQLLENPDVDLPSTDLLTALHAYAADFYAAATTNQGRHDFRSMDGSALVAMGILLEEAARSILGDAGDMALVEAHRNEADRRSSFDIRLARHQVQGRVKPQPTAPYGSEASGSSSEERPPKKRRV